MAILIDPPLWPAWGTVFSHLVSDESLAELHAFARANDVPQAAFDRDHYDVPQRRYDDLVASGAQPVRATELIRRLIASGLRVRAVDSLEGHSLAASSGEAEPGLAGSPGRGLTRCDTVSGEGDVTPRR